MSHPRHGMTGTKEYAVWNSMCTRCRCKTHKFYHRYGGRGITVCERWKTFENFYADMCPRPEGMTLERIDNDKGYSKDNCKWASQADQMRNRNTVIRVSVGDKTQCLSEWARELGVSVSSLNMRIQRGMTPLQAVITPIKPKKAKVSHL